jgi:hypothetical protein
MPVLAHITIIREHSNIKRVRQLNEVDSRRLCRKIGTASGLTRTVRKCARKLTNYTAVCATGRAGRRFGADPLAADVVEAIRKRCARANSFDV